MSFKAQINSLQFTLRALAPLFQRESEDLAVGEKARSAALTNTHSCISQPRCGSTVFEDMFFFSFSG